MSKPKNKNNAKNQKNSIPLINVWRNQYEYMRKFIETNDEKDLEKLNRTKNNWESRISKYAYEKKANQILNGMMFVSQSEKSQCVRDALNVCSIWKSKNTNNTTKLWGVSSTGELSSLVAFSRSGNEIADKIGEIINKKTVFVGSIPLHITSIMTPDFFAELSHKYNNEVFVNGEVNLEKHNEIKESLKNYFFENHVNLEQIAKNKEINESGEDSIFNAATVVMLFVSVEENSIIDQNDPKLRMFLGSYNKEQRDAWVNYISDWKENNSQHTLFVTFPEMFTRSIILGLNNYIDLSWGSYIKYNNLNLTLADINTVWVDYQENNIVLDAFAGDQSVGSATVQPELVYWPFHIVMNLLEDRGIKFLKKEKSL